MNESLRRALLRARLSEEDVAARLEVDPKTVRRWLEGRLPYLRHRWSLATMLGLDETDIWPQVGAARSRAEEFVTIYPHREDTPRDLWLGLFASADAEISILDVSGLFLAQDSSVMGALEESARSGVKVRICLRDPSACEIAADRTGAPDETSTVHIRDALVMWQHLPASGAAEIRLHRSALNNSIYRIDDEILVVQHVYGAAPERSPVLHLSRSTSSDLAATYIESFERIWNSARSASG